MTDRGMSPSSAGWPADSRIPAPAKIAEVRQFAPAVPDIGIHPDGLGVLLLSLMMASTVITIYICLQYNMIMYNLNSYWSCFSYLLLLTLNLVDA